MAKTLKDGIGYAVAEAIAEAGGDLVLWYNTNDAAISKGKKLAEKHGIRAQAYQVDVSDPAKVEEAMAQSISDFGKLDVFVANAGMAISKPITETSIEEYRKQMAVNGECLWSLVSQLCGRCCYTRENNVIHVQLTDRLSVDGVFYCAKYVGHIFKKQGFGNFIITSSMSGHIVNVPVDQPVSTINIAQV